LAALAVDAFHAAAGGDIVGVDVQHLLVAFEGEVEAAGLVEPFGFGEELFDLLDIGDELGGEGRVEAPRLGELRLEIEGRTEIWQIAVFENESKDGSGVLEASLRNPLAGEAHRGPGEPVEGLAPLGRRRFTPGGQRINRTLEEGKGRLVVVGGKGLVPLGDGLSGKAHHGLLTADFPLGNPLHPGDLRKHNHGQQRGCKAGGKDGSGAFHT